MNENEIKKMNKKELPDSFSIGTPATTGSLKCYIDMEDLETCEKKLKAFFKLKKFIDQLKVI